MEAVIALAVVLKHFTFRAKPGHDPGMTTGAPRTLSNLGSSKCTSLNISGYVSSCLQEGWQRMRFRMQTMTVEHVKAANADAPHHMGRSEPGSVTLRRRHDSHAERSVHVRDRAERCAAGRSEAAGACVNGMTVGRTKGLLKSCVFCLNSDMVPWSLGCLGLEGSCLHRQIARCCLCR